MRLRPILAIASAVSALLALFAAGCSSAPHSTRPGDVVAANEQQGLPMYSVTPREGLVPQSRQAAPVSELARRDSQPGWYSQTDTQGAMVSDSAVGFETRGSGIINFPADWPADPASREAAARISRYGGPLNRAPANLPPIITTMPGEEVWVIIQPDRLPPPMPYAAFTDEAPGCGSLMYQPAADAAPLPFPLEHTAVNAEINGYIASVNVTQQFHNPSADTIEALYVFPLPHEAAINGFLMTIGNRTIRGIIRPREQAERIYEHARAQGHTASLLTQERANIFTQHVANIEPNHRVEVDITYFHTLPYVDGWFEYVFPMVVGPRFNPPIAYGGGVGNNANPSNQPVALPYLAPGDRTGHDISINLTINAGMPIQQVACNSHRIAVREDTENTCTVRLDADPVIPNKDFVLRYRLAGDATRGGIILQRDLTQRDGDGWFTMLLVPPAVLANLHRAPVEFVFVLDTSGSMQGQPLALAAAAVDDALTRMVPGDTFQIIRFSDSASTLGRSPLPINHDTLRAARDYLANLSAGGGTQMIHGIQAALDYPSDPRRQRYVVFLTDGFIGNENEILAAMHDKIDDTRVFSFGIGTSPNRLLLDEMARVGRGAVAYLAPTYNGPATMAAFFDRVSRPALTNIEINWGSLNAADVYPRQIPDLFAGRPVILTGRYTGSPDALHRDPITIRGLTGGLERGEPTRMPIHFTVGAESVADTSSATRGLREVWARASIRDLENDSRRTGRDRSRDIETTALRNNLMSTFTSFVAVDSSDRAAGGYGVSVEVPSHAPAGTTGAGEGG